LQKRREILIVHQDWRPPGGANAVASWVLEALKADYSLTLLTWESVPTEDINRFFGTSLRPADFKVIRPNRWLRILFKLDPGPGSLQPGAYLMRLCHRIRRRYDLVMSASVEEMDLGGPGLLYIHYPELSRFWPKYRDCGGKPLGEQLRYLARGETRPWMVLADYSLERLKQNVLLTNSDWTGSLVEKLYGVKTKTLYPPVPAAGVDEVAWDRRANGFVAASRFNPRKRMDWIVSTLAEVRGFQSDLVLHLVGSKEEVGEGPKHYRELRRLAEANSAWVRLHENLPRRELSQLIAGTRYGIHAQIDEHFGIAPAEILMSGGIPFVHASGGQVEITGRDPRLCFTTQAEAVQKILAVMGDGGAQATILADLAPRRRMFPRRAGECSLASGLWKASARRFESGWRRAVLPLTMDDGRLTIDQARATGSADLFIRSVAMGLRPTKVHEKRGVAQTLVCMSAPQLPQGDLSSVAQTYRAMSAPPASVAFIVEPEGSGSLPGQRKSRGP
jgi:glycosyltransferase involved in cell wall biosynthesis